MPIFVPNKNVEADQSFGQIINKIHKEYIDPELKKRGRKVYSIILIEIPLHGLHKIYIDDEIQLDLELKTKKLQPSDTGKDIVVALRDIKNVSWQSMGLDPKSAKIMIIRFDKDWWVLKADFKKRKDLEEKYHTTRTMKVRGGGYLPLSLRRKDKLQFIKEWRDSLEKELPFMWQRYLTTTQNYRGTMVYDGNYFDLFQHAQDLYILGHYFVATIISRIVAEQVLISILIKSGKGMDIYSQKNPRHLKGIIELIDTCRNKYLFPEKFPINRTTEKRLTRVAYSGNDLVHLKTELYTSDAYRTTARRCMDDVNYAIVQHLNFIKDTKIFSGYKYSGATKRLK